MPKLEVCTLKTYTVAKGSAPMYVQLRSCMSMLEVCTLRTYTVAKGSATMYAQDVYRGEKVNYLAYCFDPWAKEVPRYNVLLN